MKTKNNIKSIKLTDAIVPVNADVTNVDSDETDFKSKLDEARAKVPALLESFGWKRASTDPRLWHLLFSQAQTNAWVDIGKRDWVDGKPPEKTVLHRARFPSHFLATQFIEAVKKSVDELTFERCAKVVESLDVHEVFFSHRVLMTTEEVTRTSCKLISHATVFGGEYAHWERQEDDPSPSADESSPGTFSAGAGKRHLRMRTEFLTDVVIARMLLAPYVIRWADCDALASDERPSGSSMDQDVEFEISEGAPSLDDLRWLLNQVDDLHVAAQTLHYADQYTGERIHYEIMEWLEPEPETMKKMFLQQQRNLEAIGFVQDRHAALVERLELHLPPVVSKPAKTAKAVKPVKAASRGRAK